MTTIDDYCRAAERSDVERRRVEKDVGATFAKLVALREELAQAVNLAVHVGRTAAGAYRVMEISEVTLADEGGIDLIPVFTFKPEGGDGQFVATGHVPAFAG